MRIYGLCMVFANINFKTQMGYTFIEVVANYRKTEDIPLLPLKERQLNDLVYIPSPILMVHQMHFNAFLPIWAMRTIKSD